MHAADGKDLDGFIADDDHALWNREDAHRSDFEEEAVLRLVRAGALEDERQHVFILLQAWQFVVVQARFQKVRVDAMHLQQGFLLFRRGSGVEDDLAVAAGLGLAVAKRPTFPHGIPLGRGLGASEKSSDVV